MSLFFRNPIFQALDDAGRPLPGALATFYLARTTTPAAIYADSALETELDNPLEANAAGVFPAIYLDDDVSYRVLLHTAAGVLRWDVDPYVCSCAEAVAPVLSVSTVFPDIQLEWTAAEIPGETIQTYEIYRLGSAPSPTFAGTPDFGELSLFDDVDGATLTYLDTDVEPFTYSYAYAIVAIGSGATEIRSAVVLSEAPA